MATEYRVVNANYLMVGPGFFDDEETATLWKGIYEKRNGERGYKIVKREVGDWQDA